MKPHFKPSCTILAAALQLTLIALIGEAALSPLQLHASVPLAWEVRPTNPAPAAFDRYHGETIHLTATFHGFGELPFDPGADVRLWYQTNGMGQAWWSAPATVQSNVISAIWSPALDPGADRVSLFFGAPSNAYASAVLRLRHSPGFTPTRLTPPVLTLDFDALSVFNAPYYTKGETEAKIVELAPPPGDYANVSNLAVNALQSYTETDPTVPAWAKAETKPAYGWSEIVGVSPYYTKGETEAKIVELAPPPGDYANVSNLAVSALQSYTETDPTVPAWAKAVTKPTYGWSEIANKPDIANMVFLASDAATNYTDGAISTNNPAFVNAVTNCPVAVASGGDGDWPIGDWGTYGTLGALVAAMAAAITWLKTNKYQKPSGGIPLDDLAQDVKDAIDTGGSGGVGFLTVQDGKVCVVYDDGTEPE